MSNNSTNDNKEEYIIYTTYEYLKNNYVEYKEYIENAYNKTIIGLNRNIYNELDFLESIIKDLQIFFYKKDLTKNIIINEIRYENIPKTTRELIECYKGMKEKTENLIEFFKEYIIYAKSEHDYNPVICDMSEYCKNHNDIDDIKLENIKEFENFTKEDIIKYKIEFEGYKKYSDYKRFEVLNFHIFKSPHFFGEFFSLVKHKQRLMYDNNLNNELELLKYILENNDSSDRIYIGELIENSAIQGLVCDEEVEKDDYNQADKKYGDKGEKRVQFELEWLSKNGFIILNSGHAVKIANENYIKYPQELDHIVIGKSGVYLIETKYYTGKIEIDESGNWYQTKEYYNIIKRRLKNPKSQMDKHESLMRSILDEEIPIYSILCMASCNTEIIGEKNTFYPIVYVDCLVDYITHIDTKNEIFNDDDKDEIAKKIMQYNYDK